MKLEGFCIGFWMELALLGIVVALDSPRLDMTSLRDGLGTSLLKMELLGGAYTYCPSKLTSESRH